jgi:predicted TIM-barrel fold metal-dependent hydrolase
MSDSTRARDTVFRHGLTLPDVFRRALDVAGPERVVFGTDSSFFPRGWNRAVHDAQAAALQASGASAGDCHRIFTSNFDRLFPP